MDETPVQVLKGTGKAATSDNYMWVRTGGPPDKPVVLFDYDATRKAEVPLRLLADWRGYLMTDGYGGIPRYLNTMGLNIWRAGLMHGATLYRHAKCSQKPIKVDVVGAANAVMQT